MVGEGEMEERKETHSHPRPGGSAKTLARPIVDLQNVNLTANIHSSPPTQQLQSPRGTISRCLSRDQWPSRASRTQSLQTQRPSPYHNGRSYGGSRKAIRGRRRI